ncbi:hypothetical protein [Parasitella parasitica]|uniref:Ndc10 domain-containing protein n=1 Tax=Parasitella parasitica TaxID=35722 RepID=A0A0B7N734_9FUNG|nr:hypothetical protein [Parasitella parasitica]
MGISQRKDCKELKSLLKHFEHSLVYDQVQISVHYVIRDSYKPGQLIRMLKALWLFASRTSLREILSIFANHHMLLRDQAMQNVNFADCFAIIIPGQQHQGKQQAVGMIFCVDKGKDLKVGEVKFACVIRHENIFRHLEPTWHNYNVIRGSMDLEEGLSASQQYNKSKDVLLQHEIYSTRITHVGRHAGIMEAESLGIPFDIVNRSGGWKDRLSHLETHYLVNLPSPFARGMAGFWQKPFFLERNQVSPPLDIQRLIFPGMETIHGKNEEWLKTYEDKMREIDENNDQGDNAQSSRPEANPRAVKRTTDTAKRAFLKLFLRLRRVILQDAFNLIAAGRGAPLDHYPGFSGPDFG